MKKMPELVQLGQEFEARGLVILGINFDQDLEVMAKAVKEHGLTWPQVHARSAAKGRMKFWHQISDLGALPHVLLVDPQGVLRYSGYPHLEDLRRRLRQLLGRRL